MKMGKKSGGGCGKNWKGGVVGGFNQKNPMLNSQGLKNDKIRSFSFY